MLTYRQSQDIITKQSHSFGREKVTLDHACGRVLAEPILADRDYPPFHRAAMDGYAIRYSDWEEGIRNYGVIETIYAGASATKPIGKGECYKIMTGAPVPPDADVVIRREDTDEGTQPGDSTQSLDPSDNGSVTQSKDPASTGRAAQSVGIRLPSCRRFQNIARQGEDIRAGATAIGTPSVIGPAVTGILASLGKNECLVERLPRVALFTTGDEVVAVDAPVSPIQIRNSNRWIMQSLLKGWGITPCHYEHLPDTKTVLRDSLQKVIMGPPSATGPSSADIIILSGGVSAGDADYVPGILEELGVQRLFHKIAIKPGKPVWCGITPGGGIVFALPGNPFSGMVGFTLLIQPYLHACFGLAAPEQLGLPLAAPKKKKTPLDEFFPVRITGSPAGLQAIDINGSGDSRLGLYANALALHPADSGDLAEGTNLLYYSL
jgi:molybdopterin molybdotransferase